MSIQAGVLWIKWRGVVKILVAEKYASDSQEILELTKQHAEAFQATVLLVTSLIGEPETDDEEIQQAEEGLAQAEAALKDAGIACEKHLLVRGMLPGEDIVEFAKEQGVDEIILGVKRKSKVGKLLFGSTAQYVILNAECPVLICK